MMSDLENFRPPTPPTAPPFGPPYKWDVGVGVPETHKAGPGTSRHTLRRHNIFYLQPVTFQVGDTLFRVLKEGFQVPGSIFEAMFSLPAGDAASPEGSSDDNPIHLPSVDESSFVAFLNVLYPSFVTEPATTDGQYRNLVAALDLATMWEFTNLRKQIILMLAPIVAQRDNLEVIHLAKKYRVAEWLRSSYKKLVLPSTDLTVGELTSSPFSLSWKTIATIYNIREILIRGALSSNTCSKCNKSYGSDYSGDRRFSGCDCRIMTLVDKHFQEDLVALADDLPDFFNGPPLVPQEIVAEKEAPRRSITSSNLKKKKFSVKANSINRA